MGIVTADGMYLLSVNLESRLFAGSPQYRDIAIKMEELNREVPGTVIVTDCGNGYHIKQLLEVVEGMHGAKYDIYQTVHELCKLYGFCYRTSTHLTDIHYVSIDAVQTILYELFDHQEAEGYFGEVRRALPALMLDGVCHVTSVGVYNIVKGEPKALNSAENIALIKLHVELWNSSVDTGCGNVESTSKPEMDSENIGVMITCHFDGDCHIYTAEDGREIESDDFINAKLYTDAELKELVVHNIADDKISIKLTTPFGGIEEYISWANLSVPLYAVWPVDPRKELMSQVENIMWDAVTDEGLKRILVVYNEERQDLHGIDNERLVSK